MCFCILVKAAQCTWPPLNLLGVWVCTQAGYCGIADVPQLHMGALVLTGDFRCLLSAIDHSTLCSFIFIFLVSMCG